MKLNRLIILCLITTTLLSPLFSDENLNSTEKIKLSEVNTAVFNAKKQMSSKKTQKMSTTSNIKYSYFTPLHNIQPKKYLFSEINFGAGFLYFNGIRLNMALVPYLDQNIVLPGNYPLKGKLCYNKTPLFEYIIGSQIGQSFKIALSFQEQRNIFLSTKHINVLNSLFSLSNKCQFSSYLALNSIMAKIYFSIPTTFIWKNISISQYIAAGVGGSWQSWSNIQTLYSTFSDTYGSTQFIFKNKVIANVATMADAGIKLKNKNPNFDFALTLGCKFNYWGQTRNLAYISQQSNLTKGLLQPFCIKYIYSFAPYMGFQWMFPVTKDFCINGRSINSNKIFWTPTTNIDFDRTLFTQINIGPNFLYFAGLKGNLAGVPSEIFAYYGTAIPLKGRIKYNKTPLYEFMIGFMPKTWFKYALSFQNQQNIFIRTPLLETTKGTTGLVLDGSKTAFTSFLSLYSLMGKLYLITPYTAIIKNAAIKMYIGAGAGISWQSYTNNTIEYTSNSFSNELSLASKYFANAVWSIDSGFLFKNARPCSLFTISTGCKYNQWGQMRSIGKITQQGNFNKGLQEPVKAKILYSFAPYIGMQWDFPLVYNYCINSKSINRWLPFITQLGNVQPRSDIFTQLNVGLGILYFDKIRGSFGGVPATAYKYLGASTFKYGMSRNKTPLYEYLVGYRPNNWLKFALSYQNQTALFLSTTTLRGFNQTPAFIVSPYNQFSAHLELNAIMAKIYFEVPYALVMKGWAASFYIAPSIGVSWQSFSDIKLYQVAEITRIASFTTNLNQQIISNATWMIDAGIRVKNACDFSPFSIVNGCKFISWGQVRNLGDITSQSNGQRAGFFKPLRIRTMYSFAPYIGFQWSF